MENEPPNDVKMPALVKFFSLRSNFNCTVPGLLFCMLLLVSATACNSDPAAGNSDDTGDLAIEVAAVLASIDSNGIDPSTINSQLGSLANLESGGPDVYGWAFTSTRTVPGVVQVSAEFQSNAPGTESEWSLLAVRIELDASAVIYEALAAELGDIFGAQPVALSATKPRRLIWQMSGFREVLVSELPNQSDAPSAPDASILVEYGIAQGEAE